MSEAVLVHIDALGARRGNGGFVMLCQLAQELNRMGYIVHVFDQLDRLNEAMFDWLSLRGRGFYIGRFSDVLNRSNAPIVTGWLPALIENNSQLLDGLDINRIRLWSGGIIRDRMDFERKLVIDNMPKIATTNSSLDWCFRKIGYKGRIIHLDNWVRPLFRADPMVRQHMLVGTQSDNFVYSVHNELREMGLEILVCEGTQDEVADKMRRCDYYVHWNRHFDCFQEVGLIGETFGLSLFEAAASGCIPIARWHQGIDFARTHIPMVHGLEDIKPLIEAYESDPYVKMMVRREAVDFVNSKYRFDDRRREAIKELLK